MSIGPTLPPWLAKKIEEKEVDDEPVSIGPSLSSKVSEKTAEDNHEDDYDDEEVNYGPALPSSSNLRTQVGPALPPEDDSDGEEFGPMPVSKDDAEKALVEREMRFAQAEYEDLLKKVEDSKPKREEWMTSMPSKMGNIGLGPRTFKRGTISEVDSSWEDAPGSKKKKKDEKKVVPRNNEAEDKQRQIVESSQKGESLLERHQAERRIKNREQELKPGERRAFDREKDMQVMGLKPAAAKDAVERMQGFTNRFAPGSDKKFL